MRRWWIVGVFLSALAPLSALPPLATPLEIARPVVNLGPPPEFERSTNLYNLASVGERVLFFASSETSTDVLWSTDGTTAGTRVVRDPIPGLGSHGGSVSNLVAAHDRAFFYTLDPTGDRLWVSDGTAAGTVPLLSLGAREPADSFVSERYRGGPLGRDFLLLRSVAESDVEVLRVDGSGDGPQLLATLAGGTFGLTPQVFSGRSRAYFGLSKNGQVERWTSDGTSSGTRRVGTFVPVTSQPFPPAPVVVGDRLFSVEEDGVHGAELWVSNGTAAGTVRLTDLGPGRESARIEILLQGERAAWFWRRTEETYELWRSDGTATGTRRISAPPTFDPRLIGELGTGLLVEADGVLSLLRADRSPRPLAHGIRACGESVRVGRFLYFAGRDSRRGCELWRSDGTAEGTALVAEFRAGEAGGISTLLPLGSRGVLSVASNAFGIPELWTTKGTASRRIARPRDVFRSGSPAFLAASDRGLLFVANRSTRRGLWLTDGTAERTRLLRTGPDWFFNDEVPRNLVPLRGTQGELGERLVYRAPTALEGLDLDGGNGEPTVATVSGSFGFGSDDETLQSFWQWEERAYFLQMSPSYQVELWRTDGTAAGTTRVKELFYAPISLFGGVAYIPSFTFVPTARGLYLLFLEGSEVWRSDGTAAGTGKVFDLDETEEASAQFLLTGVDLGGDLLFTTWGSQTGVGFWRPSAGELGAERIAAPILFTLPRKLVVLGDRAYFAAADGAGLELWVSDGATYAGCHRVADINPRRAGSSPRELTVVGDSLFFTADDGVHGRELWRSDGTSEGTVRVADLAPGAATSYPQHLAAVGDRLVWAADDQVHGLEPWIVDARGEHPALLADVASGELSSSPANFTAHAGALYFTAGRPRLGRELFRVDLPRD